MTSIFKTKTTAVQKFFILSFTVFAPSFLAACGSAGEAISSPIVMPPVGDTQTPSKPSSVSSSDVSYEQIKISWQASTDNVGVSGYKVFRDNIEITDVTGVEYSDTGLNQNTHYSYTINAYDAAGNQSAKSNPLDVTTAVYSTAQCEHTGTGSDYPVGPGQSYANPSDIDWDGVGAGDTIRIFYRDSPYKDKIVIRTGGTVEQPLRICGVEGANGERPVLDGDGAQNDLDDAAAYSTYAPLQGLAMVMVYNRDYNLKDSNIIIEGLHIKNAKTDFNFMDVDGSTRAYRRCSRSAGSSASLTRRAGRARDFAAICSPSRPCAEISD